jgi:predicted dithiol-disulfide oxidoreductase (DUF899 family)
MSRLPPPTSIHWRFPWYSSYGSDFNYDFLVSLDQSVAPFEFKDRNQSELEEVGMGWLVDGSSEQPGHRMFRRDGDSVFHTYSMFARGAEMLGGSYYCLDLTAPGRQKEWEKPAGCSPDATRPLRISLPDTGHGL